MATSRRSSAVGVSSRPVEDLPRVDAAGHGYGSPGRCRAPRVHLAVGCPLAPRPRGASGTGWWSVSRRNATRPSLLWRLRYGPGCASRQGCLAIRIRDTLGELFADAQFAQLFATRGRPAVSPARLALVLVLQFAEGLFGSAGRRHGPRPDRLEVRVGFGAFRYRFTPRCSGSSALGCLATTSPSGCWAGVHSGIGCAISQPFGREVRSYRMVPRNAASHRPDAVAGLRDVRHVVTPTLVREWRSLAARWRVPCDRGDR